MDYVGHVVQEVGRIADTMENSRRIQARQEVEQRTADGGLSGNSETSVRDAPRNEETTLGKRIAAMLLFALTWSIIIGGYVLLGVGIFFSSQILMWIGIALWCAGVCLCCSRRKQAAFQGRVLTSPTTRSRSVIAEEDITSITSISNQVTGPDVPPPYYIVAGKLPTYEEAIANETDPEMQRARDEPHDQEVEGSVVFENVGPPTFSDLELAESGDFISCRRDSANSNSVCSTDTVERHSGGEELPTSSRATNEHPA